jgi:hypothetical protein
MRRRFARLAWRRPVDRPAMVAATAALAFYAEALLAGWVQPLPELRAKPLSQPATQANGDVEGLVNRYYFHQRC